jgi:hypothetical protein
MMNEQKYSVVSLYHLPGFNTDRSAHIQFTGTKEKCRDNVTISKRLDLLQGFGMEYEYNILPVDEARAFADEKNATKERNLAIWRNKVYGEPLPV